MLKPKKEETMKTKNKANSGAKSAKKVAVKAVQKKPLKKAAEIVDKPVAAKREVRYKVIGQVPEKLSPQARCIIELIANYGNDGVSRQQLIEELKPLLKTRQPTERVLSFYTVVLKHDGIITSEKISV
jgi:hypothetical protein